MATGNQIQSMFEAAVVARPLEVIESLDPDQRAEVLAILDKIRL